MAKKIDGAKVWESLIDEGAMSEQMPAEEQKLVMRGFVENDLPVALEAVADLPASGENIFRAVAAYCNAMLEKDVLRRLADVTPLDSGLGFFTADDLCEMATDTAREAVRQYGEFVKDFAGFLAENDITEEDVLKRFGMHVDNIRKVRSGNLTIGELLLSQPSVILNLNK